MRRGLLLGFACLATAAALVAQDVKPGASVPSAFRSFVVTDDRFPPKVTPVKAPEDRDPRDRTDKMHCLVCEYGLNPAVLVFSRATPAEDGPAAKFAKQLDLILQTREARANSFNAAVVFLTLEAEYPADAARNDSRPRGSPSAWPRRRPRSWPSGASPTGTKPSSCCTTASAWSSGGTSPPVRRRTTRSRRLRRRRRPSR